MRRSSQSHQPAGVSLAHLVLDFHIAREDPKSRRRYQFFESTSFSARLSNVSSATTCFSFRFSSSNCFSFFASPLSIPPYSPKPGQENCNERYATQRRADHRDSETRRSRTNDGGVMPPARDRGADLLSLEGKVWGDGKWRGE